MENITFHQLPEDEEFFPSLWKEMEKHASRVSFPGEWAVKVTYGGILITKKDALLPILRTVDPTASPKGLDKLIETLFEQGHAYAAYSPGVGKNEGEWLVGHTLKELDEQLRGTRFDFVPKEDATRFTLRETSDGLILIPPNNMYLRSPQRLENALESLGFALTRGEEYTPCCPQITFRSSPNSPEDLPDGLLIFETPLESLIGLIQEFDEQRASKLADAFSRLPPPSFSFDQACFLYGSTKTPDLSISFAYSIGRVNSDSIEGFILEGVHCGAHLVSSSNAEEIQQMVLERRKKRISIYPEDELTGHIFIRSRPSPFDQGVYLIKAGEPHRLPPEVYLTPFPQEGEIHEDLLRFLEENVLEKKKVRKYEYLSFKPYEEGE